MDSHPFDAILLPERSSTLSLLFSSINCLMV
jgi:hypothetical protein